jgi:hypothetical protein
VADSCSSYAEGSKLTPHCCEGTTTVGEVVAGVGIESESRIKSSIG